MKTHVNLVMAQLNFLVGDIEGNAKKILTATTQAKSHFQADCLICPELALTGYPPEDLLLRDDCHQRVRLAIEKLHQEIQSLREISLIFGCPQRENQRIYNAACIIQPGKRPQFYYKQCLPNYGVFDEKRYFTPGTQSCFVELHGTKLGILICEDLWEAQPSIDLQTQNCTGVIVLNASPFDIHKGTQRQLLLSQRARTHHCPYIYVHCVGGQDEFVFDGGSLAVNADGEVAVAGNYFEEELIPVRMTSEIPAHIDKQMAAIAAIDPIAQAYSALVLGVRDYVRKNGFTSVLIGLSGGIDSALTATIAVDALGAENVFGLFMPSRYTSELSRSANQHFVENLKVHCDNIAIEKCYQAFLDTLATPFKGYREDITEENLQARIRGTLLMAIANKKNHLVLTTSNKSESAVGYTTLYGDMAGGFAVIKDVPKTLVYQLCDYRNQVELVIPSVIIHRAPTAELAPNQKDSDSLPAYDILDAILEYYVEHDKSLEDIVAHGYAKDVVEKVIRLVKRAEFKRRQAPPGVRITSKAFGCERRYPITSGF